MQEPPNGSIEAERPPVWDQFLAGSMGRLGKSSTPLSDGMMASVKGATFLFDPWKVSANPQSAGIAAAALLAQGARVVFGRYREET